MSNHNQTHVRRSSLFDNPPENSPSQSPIVSFINQTIKPHRINIIIYAPRQWLPNNWRLAAGERERLCVCVAIARTKPGPTWHPLWTLTGSSARSNVLEMVSLVVIPNDRNYWDFGSDPIDKQMCHWWEWVLQLLQSALIVSTFAGGKLHFAVM